SKARVVESVEELGAEIEAFVFANLESFADGSVEIEVGRCLLGADGRVAEEARGGVAVGALAIVHSRRAEAVAGAEPVVDRLVLIGEGTVMVGAHIAANGLVRAIHTQNGYRE